MLCVHWVQGASLIRQLLPIVVIWLERSHLACSHRVIGWCHSWVLTRSEITFDLCLLLFCHIIVVRRCRLVRFSTVFFLMWNNITWRSCSFLWFFLLLLLQCVQIRGNMESWLASNLLLLVKRYLMVELLQQKLWVVQYTRTLWLFSFTASMRFSSIFQFFFLDIFLVLSQGSKLMVEIIAIEKCLYRRSPKIGQVFLELWFIKIFPFFVDVFLVKIFFFWRYEWCYDIFVF